jgi:hypothetical protein
MCINFELNYIYYLAWHLFNMVFSEQSFPGGETSQLLENPVER